MSQQHVVQPLPHPGSRTANTCIQLRLRPGLGTPPANGGGGLVGPGGAAPMGPNHGTPLGTSRQGGPQKKARGFARSIWHFGDIAHQHGPGNACEVPPQGKGNMCVAGPCLGFCMTVNRPEMAQGNGITQRQREKTKKNLGILWRIRGQRVRRRREGQAGAAGPLTRCSPHR